MGCGVKCKKVVRATFGALVLTDLDWSFQTANRRFKGLKMKNGRPHFDKSGLAIFLKNP